jgi:hypothetical protein
MDGRKGAVDVKKLQFKEACAVAESFLSAHMVITSISLTPDGFWVARYELKNGEIKTDGQFMIFYERCLNCS